MYFKEIKKTGEIILEMNLYQYNPPVSSSPSDYTDDDYETITTMFHINSVGNVLSKTAFNTNRPTIRHDYYLLYVCEGSYGVETESSSFSLKENEFIIISPNSSHHNIHPDSHNLYYCFLHFTGYAVPEILDSLGLKADTIYKSNKSPSEIEGHFNKVIDEFRLLDTVYQTAAVGRSISLLTHLSRSTSNSSHRRMLRSSLSYIREHLSSELYIETLAEIENMSVQHYRQVFKEHIGVSPNQHIINERLALACELLSHTASSVIEISQQCGYSDSLYFSRLFKQRFGLSPLTYRKKNTIFHA